MESGFIDDGQYFPRFIEGAPGMYPDVSLWVRVCTRSEQRNWGKRVTKLDSAEDSTRAEKFTAEFIASRIESWSLDRAATAENVLRLHPLLNGRILGIVLGDEAGDPLPSGEAVGIPLMEDGAKN